MGYSLNDEGEAVLREADAEQAKLMKEQVILVDKDDNVLGGGSKKESKFCDKENLLGVFLYVTGTLLRAQLTFGTTLSKECFIELFPCFYSLLKAS